MAPLSFSCDILRQRKQVAFQVKPTSFEQSVKLCDFHKPFKFLQRIPLSKIHAKHHVLIIEDVQSPASSADLLPVHLEMKA